MRLLRSILVALVIPLMFAAKVHADDFDDGMAAYVRDDDVTAFKLFLPLAEQGDARAQVMLDVVYDEGVPQGDAEAVEWHRRAAEQGVLGAQLNLAFMYYEGEGVPQDYAEAAKWYRKLAEWGLASAQNDLGNMYHKGEGVPQDYAEAVKWYRLAADQGDATAQYNLGVMYAKGEGVPEDVVLAYMWFNLSVAHGDTIAQKGKDIASEKMTPDQIAEAQRMSRKWWAAHQK